MTTQAAPPARRWIALLVFIALPLGLAVMAALNAWGAVEISGLARTAESQLSRLAGRTPNPGDAAAEQDLSPIFILAPARSLAEADLQRRVIAMIESTAARVVESATVDVPEADGDRIEVQATLDTDNDGLLRLLHAIETELPLLSVEELAVRHLQSEPLTGAAEPELRVDLRILGHWRSTVP